jgi:glycosyltransferase involved in cell wall biosynthesis
LPYAYNYHRASLFLLYRALKEKADLYIGHDLTALPIAVKVAKRNKAKAGFDAEDFHRNEVSDDQNTYQYKAANKLEDQYIPQLDHFTAASPLIAEAYHQLYPQKKATVINNVFSQQFISEQITPFKGTLKLFWFSQTIGKDRGLEQVITAMGKLANAQITLTLLGMISATEQTDFEALAIMHGLTKKQLIFLAPVAPHQIFEIASQHHIGLALELNKPYNRDICLTNKILTYLTAGLSIIASETKAQKQFMIDHPNIGQSFPIGDLDALTDILNTYLSTPILLQQQQEQAKDLANNKLNWEMESKKLLSSID